MIHRTRTCLAIAILAITMGWHAGVLSFNPRIDLPKATAFVRDTYGDSAQTRVERWVEHLDQLKGKSEDLQLRSVNTFWNTTVREAEDISLWKQEDYWATPLESLGRQAGDCEDFVIGKYFSLLYLGVPAEKLRVIYVSATINGPTGRKTISHMVLGYYPKPDADPLVLDNLNTEILPGSKRRDLKPVFSFNAQGIYVPGKANASADRLGRWSTLLARMREQGLPV